MSANHTLIDTIMHAYISKHAYIHLRRHIHTYSQTYILYTVYNCMHACIHHPYVHIKTHITTHIRPRCMKLSVRACVDNAFDAVSFCCLGHWLMQMHWVGFDTCQFTLATCTWQRTCQESRTVGLVQTSSNHLSFQFCARPGSLVEIYGLSAAPWFSFGSAHDANKH